MKDILSSCEKYNIPCAPINTVQEMTEDPQVLHRNMVSEMEDPRLGIVKTTGPVVKMSDTPPAIQSASPEYGGHNYEIYHSLLGYSDHDIAQLKKDGVI